MSDDSMTPKQALVWRLAKYLSRGRSEEDLRELLHANFPERDVLWVEALIRDARELVESEDQKAVERLISEVEG